MSLCLEGFAASLGAALVGRIHGHRITIAAASLLAVFFAVWGLWELLR